MQKDQLLERLDRLERQLYAYRYAMGLMEYDGETAAPLLSAAGRGEALALLSDFHKLMLSALSADES